MLSDASLSDKLADVNSIFPQPAGVLTMSLTRNFGVRTELVSMDPHFHDITIALYRQDHEGRPEYLVHSYSGLEGASQRIESLRRSMVILGQLVQVGDWLHFACGSEHQAAARRAFLETVKLAPGAANAPRPLTVLDKKSGRNITATNLGGGQYQITADGPEEGKAARIEGILGGLVKLAQVSLVDGKPDQFGFSCGQSHDALIGMLLPRALNVRAILREEESAEGRGQLVAPSQQK